MKVVVRPVKAYGKVRYYPENESSVELLKFRERKSYTKDQLKILKDMGVEIEILNQHDNEDYKII